MSLLNFNPITSNLLTSTSQLINQPALLPNFQNLIPEEDVNFATMLTGGKESKAKAPKKEKKKSKAKAPKKEKKEKKESKSKKEIDTYLKPQLVKIAKKYDVALKSRDGTLKTKEQLFASLKRKKLI
jgi:hypothetical protein